MQIFLFLSFFLPYYSPFLLRIYRHLVNAHVHLIAHHAVPKLKGRDGEEEEEEEDNKTLLHGVYSITL